MKRHAGQAMIHTLGLLLLTVIVGPLTVDGALYFAHSQGERNAADAAALASVNELFRGDYTTTLNSRMTAARSTAKTLAQQNYGQSLNDADIEFGYVNPVTGAYNAGTFSTPSTDTAFSPTGGYNAVRINVRAAEGQANQAVPSIFAAFLGHDSFNSAAQAVAIYGGGVQSAGGLRPIYLCQVAWDQAKAQFGDPTRPKIRFYGQTLTMTGPSGNTVTLDQAGSCGNLGPGNWGLADFDENGGGTSQLNDNILYGYDGIVTLGENYSPKTGNSLNSSSSELATLKNNGTIINLPLYSQTSGVGDNAQFLVSQIAGFVITDFKANGNNTYVEGYFRKTACAKRCTLGSAPLGGATTTLRLVR